MSVFNEDTRVKIPATIQFLRLDYDYQSLKADDIDIDFNTKIFVNRFKPALEKINGRKYSYDEIKSIITDINNVLKNNDLGKEFYNWLIDPQDKVKLIDFEDISKQNYPSSGFNQTGITKEKFLKLYPQVSDQNLDKVLLAAEYEPKNDTDTTIPYWFAVNAKRMLVDGDSFANTFDD